MTPPRDITFVLTSCGRFDLLAETLRTFVACNTAPIARWLVVEDSGREEVRDVVRGAGVPIELIVNDPPVGQMTSIDRAYATVDTPYIFHCEDDWRFFRSGFVEESLVLLETLATVSAVMCRRPGQNRLHDAIVGTAQLRTEGGVACRLPERHAHDVWFGYGFNPGLRRLADARAIGSFAARGQEKHASLWFKRRGMGMAALEHPACETTGHGQHVADPAAAVDGGHAWRSRPPGDFEPPGSRNDPCPCGSGERYKLCHGLPP